jgi:hypothetical protein
MRCVCCNNILTRNEDRLMNKASSVYQQTCFNCLKGLGVEVTGPVQLDEEDDSYAPELDTILENDFLYDGLDIDEFDENDEWRGF